MSRSIHGITCCLALLGLVAAAGCQKGKKAQASATEEEGWNSRAAYKPPPTSPAPPEGGNRSAGAIVGNAGQNVRQGAERQKAKGILKNIGDFYVQYHTENGRSPANQNEFIAYIQREAPHVVEAIKNDYFVVTWNAALSSNTILAYEKTSYAGARTVLRGDTSISVMPDADFNRAIKGGQ